MLVAARGLSCLMALCLAAAAPAAQSPEQLPIRVDPSQDEFTVIVVPDTQRYSAYFPHIMRSQFRWIRDHVAALNAKYVVHLGDVVETGAESEWVLADEVFSMLDDVVPYTVVPGNHDLDPEARPARVHHSTRFNAVFSPKRFIGQPWYGGHKGVTGDNSFGYFTAAGQSYMVLGLEFGPSDDTLAWARSLAGNTDHSRIIVITHCYMYDDDTRVGEGDDSSPHKLNAEWNDGEQIWEKFVRRANNVGMVLSGHIKGDGTGRLVSQREGGTPVLQMLSNYQFLEHGGKGWLRILKFSPRTGALDVVTYSPWLGRTHTAPDQQFTIAVPWMFPQAER